MIRYTEVLLGTLTIDQRGRQFEIQIRQGNCMAVFIHVRKNEKGDGYIHTLYSFFSDAKHVKNIVKSSGKPIGDDVVSIRLNMKHKESYSLLRVLVPHYNVECYYEG